MNDMRFEDVVEQQYAARVKANICFDPNSHIECSFVQHVISYTALQNSTPMLNAVPRVILFFKSF